MELANLSNLANRIVVTCSKRLSPYLEEEICELGFNPVRTFSTGLELSGTMNDCIRLNLNLRCASQVLYSLKEFPSNSPVDIYQEVTQIPWERILSHDNYFSVTSNVAHPTINNSLFANVKVKDAIVDSLRNKTGGRPNSGSSLEAAVIHLFWKDETAEIFIDTSGQTLSKHGIEKFRVKHQCWKH